nr:hypothetical protein [Tanacetum cinerariifolium]
VSLHTVFRIRKKDTPCLDLKEMTIEVMEGENLNDAEGTGEEAKEEGGDVAEVANTYP